MEAVQELVQQLHAHASCGVLSMTGGGSAGLADLLCVPGASNTILEAIVPYAHQSLVDWLGYRPDQSCCAQTALQMATRALARAEELTHGSREARPLWGLGVTAALASSRPKKGEHRAFVAIHQPHQSGLLKVVFAKGKRTRGQEEELLGQLIIQQLASSLGINTQLHPQQLGLTDDDQWQQLQAGGETRMPVMNSSDHPVSWWDVSQQQPGEAPAEIRGLLSGSFNPLHRAHQELFALAKDRLGGGVFYELSLHNADKPAIDYLSLQKRLSQFQQQHVLLSRLSTFMEKAEQFPQTVFVIGADTAVRVLQKKFYRNSETQMNNALHRIAEHGCRFLVAARPMNGSILSLGECEIPTAFRDLFEAIPQEDFLLDFSSTQLRAEHQFEL